MSKVICDVCGTSFPETSAQCPICGSACNSAAAASGVESAVEAGAGGNYVRGGRFSKGNVKKMNEGKPVPERRGDAPRRERPAREQRREAPQQEQKDGSNKILVIVVVLLLLAIVAVCIYIGVRFFAPAPNPNPGETQGSQQTQPSEQTQPSQETDPSDSIPCTGIQLSGAIIEFTDPERSQLLTVVLEPSDTTDEVTFTSSDESVAIVSESGIITPVGNGEATITVTCGDIVKECLVHCNLSESGDSNTDTPTEPSPSFVSIILKGGWLNNNGIRDITLDKPGKVFNIYDSASTAAAAEITWPSKNPAIATVSNGKVTAVSKGKTEIYATYGDVQARVIIRCNWADGTPPETQATTATTAPPSSGGTIVVNPYPIMNRMDFTLSSVGKTWDLYKGTDMSQTVNADQIEWSSADESVCTIVNGVVTATGTGETKVYAKYGDAAYECIVRVK